MPSVLRAAEPQDLSPGLLRTPPHNAEAERALLGAILLNNRSFERVSDYLLAEHFSDPVNARIYTSVTKLLEQGHQANPVTLKTYLERDELVIAAGGMKYLAGLTNSMVTVINAGDYGRLIYDLFLRRELITIGEDMVNGAFDAQPDETANDQIEGSEQKLFELASSGNTEEGFKTFETALKDAIDLATAAHRRDGALAGVTTGLIDLDNKLGGLHPSDLVILAGRPGMGKSALATNIACAAARYFSTTDRAEARGKRVALFSLEMSAEQLANRILAEQSRINSHDIRTGKLSNEDFDRLVRASTDLTDLPLDIDDTPALTMSAIRTRCRRLARQRKNTAAESGLGLIVIDYLQLIAPSRSERAENRVQEISAITRGLKALAKDLNVPVIALSQLSRAVEQREDKRPQLSDLRESGTIEQDSDVVMFIYREEYYHERTEPTPRSDEGDDKFRERHGKWQERGDEILNIAEVIIAKQRHGPIGIVKLHFEANFTHFSDHVDTGYLPEQIG